MKTLLKREDNNGLLMWEKNNLFTVKLILTQLKPNVVTDRIGKEKVNN